MKKSIAIGIICLLIGVGIAPALAVEVNPVMVNYPSVGDSNFENFTKIQLKRMGVLLERLEGNSKLLLLLSRSNPVIHSMCLELSDGIDTVSNYYDELIIEISNDEYPIICGILEPLYRGIYALANLTIKIYDFIDPLFPLFMILGLICNLSLPIYGIIVFLLWATGVGFGCWAP
jgi:hypothetical protein